MYKQKYLKYKQKYLELKKNMGGGTLEEDMIAKLDTIEDTGAQLIKRRLTGEIRFINRRNSDFFTDLEIDLIKQEIKVISKFYTFILEYKGGPKSYPLEPPLIISNNNGEIVEYEETIWNYSLNLYTIIPAILLAKKATSLETMTEKHADMTTQIIVVGRSLYQILANTTLTLIPNEREIAELTDKLNNENIESFSINIINKLIENDNTIHENIKLDAYDDMLPELPRFDNRNFNTPDKSKSINFKFYQKHFHISNDEIPLIDYIFIDWSTFKFIHSHDNEDFTSIYSFFYLLYNKLNNDGFLYTFGRADWEMQKKNYKGIDDLVKNFFTITNNTCEYLTHDRNILHNCYIFKKRNDKETNLNLLKEKHVKLYDKTKENHKKNIFQLL